MYNHQEIESKWRRQWEADHQYRVIDNSEQVSFYCLDMFPYPSGTGLHVGHPKGYIATDILSRFKHLNGFNVLHPMGWDAFGLPAENYALKNKVHPRIATQANVVTYKEQINKLGFTYDWDREINTTDSEYYKWTQWAFAEMFKRGLVYESNEPINWCPTCLTGLANEDLEAGNCERCGTPIEKKPLRQWVIRITDYAERLLDDLNLLYDWDHNVKEMQRNWIGKSEGATVNFQCLISNPPERLESFSRAGDKSNPKSETEDSPLERGRGVLENIEVFTTRPDTIFGATYLVVCPEHPLVTSYELRVTNIKEVQAYIDSIKNKSDLERTDLNKDKSGVELKGIRAINPATNEEIPIFVADYVLAGYGTGAIMAVPAHDERDFEFATKYKLPIRLVVTPPALEKLNRNADDLATGAPNEITAETDFWSGEGVAINSDFLDGLETKTAKDKIITWLEDKQIGTKKINYKLKDWVFSRQRYWGEPIPLIFCSHCKILMESSKSSSSVPSAGLRADKQFPNDEQKYNQGELINPGWFVDEDLPLKLPEVESYEPSGTGESPLANITDWVKVKCPHCGGEAKRETNTMPQWAGSSWYYLAYLMRDNQNSNRLPAQAGQPADKIQNYKEVFDKWLPVDMYVGGAEHVTRHMIYARFWHKFLQDIGVVTSPEPFLRYRSVGLVLAEDGRKMSKRWNNVINPDDIVISHGADALRLYEMFMGPFDQAVAWNTQGLSGVRKFLDKVNNLSDKLSNRADSQELERLLHKTIKKVANDIESFNFNTAVSAMMILVNKLTELGGASQANFETLLIILSPFAPYLTEELWHRLGHTDSIYQQAWPIYRAELAKDDEITLVIQVNGKVRDTLLVASDLTQEQAEAVARTSQKVMNHLISKPKKIIYIQNKLISFVL